MNAYISDLFFNLDHSGDEAPRGSLAGNKDTFQGYDDAKLLAQATWLLNCLDGLMCCGCHNALPSAPELVADFKRRL
jgi:hypothetical protein